MPSLFCGLGQSNAVGYYFIMTGVIFVQVVLHNQLSIHTLFPDTKKGIHPCCIFATFMWISVVSKANFSIEMIHFLKQLCSDSFWWPISQKRRHEMVLISQKYINQCDLSENDLTPWLTDNSSCRSAEVVCFMVTLTVTSFVFPRKED